MQSATRVLTSKLKFKVDVPACYFLLVLLSHSVSHRGKADVSSGATDRMQKIQIQSWVISLRPNQSGLSLQAGRPSANSCRGAATLTWKWCLIHWSDKYSKCVPNICVWLQILARNTLNSNLIMLTWCLWSLSLFSRKVCDSVPQGVS